MTLINESTQQIIDKISVYTSVNITFSNENNLYKREVYLGGKLVSIIEGLELEYLDSNLEYTLITLYNGILVGLDCIKFTVNFN